MAMKAHFCCEITYDSLRMSAVSQRTGIDAIFGNWPGNCETLQSAEHVLGDVQRLSRNEVAIL
jgi:hypothetical protein